MKTIHDCFGRSVRLTDERLAHILQHPEMAGMEAEIERVLRFPAEVRVSRADLAENYFMNSMPEPLLVPNGYVSW